MNVRNERASTSFKEIAVAWVAITLVDAVIVLAVVGVWSLAT